MTLSVQRLDSIKDISAEAWNSLLTAEDPPVLRHEWIAAMEESGSAVPSRGWKACHFLLWHDNFLIGAAPAWLKFHSFGEYIYDFGWANAAAARGIQYYPKMLVGLPLSPITARRILIAPQQQSEPVQRALIQAITDAAREHQCSSVHVLFSPPAEAEALGKLGFFHRRTMQYHFTNPGYATYDEYLSRFDSKRRNQLKRERAAAAQQGISLRTVRSKELQPQHAELAFRLYQDTASRYGWGAVQLTADFFRRVFASMPWAIEMVVAERAGQVVAGAFNLHSPTTLYGRYWGCFEEHPFLHFHVCLYHSIDECIRLGRRTFEPGAGGEHKISRGFEPTIIHSSHLAFDAAFHRLLDEACTRESGEVEHLVAQGPQLTGMRPWRESTAD